MVKGDVTEGDAEDSFQTTVLRGSYGDVDMSCCPGDVQHCAVGRSITDSSAEAVLP